MSGGYTATTEALNSTSKSVGKLAEQLIDDNPDLESTPIKAESFGRVHGSHAEKYTAGVKALWDSVNGYSSTLGGFGTKLGTAGSAYGSAESDQADAITKAGQQQ
ncbi:hypothetical protein [Amycolatopsis suaedae]|uniref:WXG100 family type VII secretion target n=1 Tax=Amycolatopsis suaedae TaxID=2510978 RepID=A0A4Q7J4J3_9PSEU|nr:hypothetical protein [Amycolatopsis suaedae]RZQ61927.1 hypothetical protein EWH70_20135 [Amycolatopsis suaedae]